MIPHSLQVRPQALSRIIEFIQSLFVIRNIENAQWNFPNRKMMKSGYLGFVSECAKNHTTHLLYADDLYIVALHMILAS